MGLATDIMKSADSRKQIYLPSGFSW